MLKKGNTTTFRSVIYRFYRIKGRHDLPWRATVDPYHIVVSELMLQQTQVSRVIPKYKNFLKQFPTIRALARAPLSQVLRTWSGLGYNRRAKFLHQMAIRVVRDHQGKLPSSIEILETLPGIGSYTARAVSVFAYNKPVALIETNIRTVFLHHFFKHKNAVVDRDIMVLIEKTLDRKYPRKWYWALMDYGAYLKQSGNTAHRASAGYKKQSPFKGSGREVRGALLRTLTQKQHTLKALHQATAFSPERVEKALGSLTAEGLIVKRGRSYRLAEM